MTIGCGYRNDSIFPWHGGPVRSAALTDDEILPVLLPTEGMPCTYCSENCSCNSTREVQASPREGMTLTGEKEAEAMHLVLLCSDLNLHRMRKI